MRVGSRSQRRVIRIIRVRISGDGNDQDPVPTLIRSELLMLNAHTMAMLAPFGAFQVQYVACGTGSLQHPVARVRDKNPTQRFNCLI
jgi:hypothetical protein